ncbi:hypothetical protein XM38_050190 [Halomicronema hongdechloris C2206]|uniref:DUF2358 domain-containing protein n=1 Tax=Halomicronema hongdechloris C2206 TaxID=1641165 RepID=A0A1Z3HUU2_9CYAN|nr:DUF2358 domain-containing protein [Halomicronema hongdechloris]ASC74045.1 hypothetical protein XM38_050190 [Halomicronema hongdechloris C2206]
MASSSSPPLQPPPQEVVDQVIDRLEAELPTLFETDLTYDIYTQDILFKDPVNRFRGKFNYRIVFWTLRFHGRLFFTELHFDLHRVYRQATRHIRADWTVRGTLRLPWRPRILFNGVSDYQLNAAGLIYQHIDTWDRPPGDVLRQFWRGPGGGVKDEG